MEITERLAEALHDLVRASDAAAESPADRQMARRAIESATVVAHVAKRDGFGVVTSADKSNSEEST